MLCPSIVLLMFACSGTPSFDSVYNQPWTLLDSMLAAIPCTECGLVPKRRNASLAWSCNDVTAEILFDLRRFLAYVVGIIAAGCDWIGPLVSITFWKTKRYHTFVEPNQIVECQTSGQTQH